MNSTTRRAAQAIANAYHQMAATDDPTLCVEAFNSNLGHVRAACLEAIRLGWSLDLQQAAQALDKWIHDGADVDELGECAVAVRRAHAADELRLAVEEALGAAHRLGLPWHRVTEILVDARELAYPEGLDLTSHDL